MVLRYFGLSIFVLMAASACASPMVDHATASSSPGATPAAPLAVQDAEVRSPSGDLVVSVVSNGGQPQYSVTYKGDALVGASSLGLRFATGASLDARLQIVSVEQSSTDETWELPWGERRLVRDRHNQLTVKFQANDNPIGYTLRVRVFDEGLGFRYEVPDTGERIVVDEITEFTVDGDATAWWTPAGAFNRLEY
ncbi:MAG: glycoside hydrolase family 97 N-terminal domain-containing protein, partial [Pseudomonadota bacterium]